jgi:hypothetical protein
MTRRNSAGDGKKQLVAMMVIEDQGQTKEASKNEELSLLGPDQIMHGADQITIFASTPYTKNQPRVRSNEKEIASDFRTRGGEGLVL